MAEWGLLAFDGQDRCSHVAEGLNRPKPRARQTLG